MGCLLELIKILASTPKPPPNATPKEVTRYHKHIHNQLSDRDSVCCLFIYSFQSHTTENYELEEITSKSRDAITCLRTLFKSATSSFNLLSSFLSSDSSNLSMRGRQYS